MAKTARRSVASNPSSLTSSPKSNFTVPLASSKARSKDISQNQRISSNLTLPTPSPLRSGEQYTTQTVPIYGNSTLPNYSNSSATNQEADSNNNAKVIPPYTRDYNQTLRLAQEKAENERIRMEFYATYDVMTGVRIAATLGGFFSLMVFLIVWKSRSHSDDTLKVLKDPKIAAAAAACMQEEEEREIQEAIEATGLSIYPDEYDNMLFRRQRMLSLGNVSAPPVLNRRFRYSSVGGGGYSSLLEPPRRFSYSGGSRRKNPSEFSRVLSAYPTGSSFGTDDYFIETDDEIENELDHLSDTKIRDPTRHLNSFLEVPPEAQGQESRRSSGMTCCSTESSYLERRCSAITLGLTALPSNLDARMQKSPSRRSSTDTWDYYYPDIQIIQPTPKTSPCPSEKSGIKDTHQHYVNRRKRSIDHAHHPSAHYQHTSTKRFYKRGCYNESDSITEFPIDKQSYSISEEANDQTYHSHSLDIDHRTYSPRYDDSNELSLLVNRSMMIESVCVPTSASANNNHIFNISSCNPSCVDDSSIPDAIDGTNSRRAPLASISSFKISSIDFQDSDLKSFGSDSVFVESYADTDDDMEQFSTDSDISVSAENDNDQTLPLARKRQEILPHHNTNVSIKSEPPRTVTLRRSSTSNNDRPGNLRHQRSVSMSSNDRVMLLRQQSQDTGHEDSFTRSDQSDPTGITLASSTPGQSPLAVAKYHREQKNSQQPVLSTANTATPTPTQGTTATSLSQNITEIENYQSQPSTIGCVRTTSFSCDNNNPISCSTHNINSGSNHTCSNQQETRSKHDKKKLLFSDSKSECIEANVILDERVSYRRPRSALAISETSKVSPSVILELPVISLPSQDAENYEGGRDLSAEPPRDPSLPGTSRKWSKETLF